MSSSIGGAGSGSGAVSVADEAVAVVRELHKVWVAEQVGREPH